MSARIQTFHHPAAKLDELTMLTRKQAAAEPRPRGLKGFQFLIDCESGKAMLISFWETEEELRSLEAINASTRGHIKAETGIESPVAEIFEVAL